MVDKLLIGKTVRAAFINEDRTTIRLEMNDDAAFELDCFAECCSDTWIEHVNGAESLAGRMITKVEHKELGAVIPTRQQFDQLYSTTIMADLRPGERYSAVTGCQIEYRNSSNGYYGGAIHIRPASNPRPTGFVELKDF